MKVTIIPNFTRDKALDITEKICAELDRIGIEYCIPPGYRSGNSAPDSQPENTDRLIKDSDAVIAVGGDGAIIHAAKEAVKHSKPILGINAGRLAFMAGLENDELDKLSCLIDGNYAIDRRLMLKTTLTNGVTQSFDFALNDCYITNNHKQRMSNMQVFLNSEKINDYVCDGIIISTPTGSTAYSLSAGGPVIDPQLESILLTPVCPHTLFNRSIIFKPSDRLSIKSAEGEKLFYSNDGNEPKSFDGNHIIEISSADFTANFIRIKNDNFIDILYRKMKDRM
ncbi:MAG: NAD(+)/NADH kinase [Clostridia bacterium]|nr:NAD(+)/NADH kinase [Clostridia bacterium]